MPNFAIERLTRGAPDMANLPLALTGREGGREWVIQCSKAAKDDGVSPRMPASGARALCAALHGVPESPQEDEQALQALAISLLKFSPIVCLDPLRPRGSGSLFLDIKGTVPHFGGEGRLARLAREHCLRLGYRAYLSLSPNLSASRLLARVLEGQKTIGVRVDESELEKAIGSLPWSLLRLDAKQTEALGAFGVHTFGDLMALPRAGLSLRLGAPVLEQIDEALGKKDESLTKVVPPDHFEETLRWWPPTKDHSQLLFAAKKLFDSAEGYLEGCDRVVHGAVLSLRGPDISEPIPLRLRPRRPTRSSHVLLTLLQRRLENREAKSQSSDKDYLPNPATENAIEEIHLSFERLEPQDRRQESLFENHRSWREGPLASLCDRLSSRLGEERILGASLVADHRPEYAYRLCELTPCLSDSSNSILSSSSGPVPPGRRPLFLESPPVLLSLLCQRPHQPSALINGPEQGPLTVISGPERIESGWWDGQDIRRLYFEVQTHQGTHLWIFLDLKSERWFRHGWFA